MAGSNSSSSGAGNPCSKIEPKSIAINISIKIPRRKLTLITITLLLNILLWSSLVCLATSFYQVASDPKDMTNIALVVLTSTSALVTISYTFFHTIISFKQRIWMHQRRHPSAMKKTSYVAVRFVVSLCVLWMLTSGWNMIIVARRPLCLSEAPELQNWEFGTKCYMSRVGMAFAMVALVVSFALFGVLCAVRRPFEAHLLKHGYQRSMDPNATPADSREVSPASEKPPHGRRRSASTQRSTHSNFSGTDVETLDLNSSPAPSTIHAPSPLRSIGLGIFTSDSTPPPIPSAYIAPPRTSSLGTPSPVFEPSIYHHSLSRPPRISGLAPSSGYAPLAVPAQFSASAWRALHPAGPPPMRPASRSNPPLPTPGFLYNNRYSRSSVSLTRPRRLSTATPVGSIAWSSRSGSTGPEGRDSPFSGDHRVERRATSAEIAYAIMNGLPIPGTTWPDSGKTGSIRTASPSNTTSGAEPPPPVDRKAMGWRPNVPDQHHHHSSEVQRAPETEVVAPFKLVQSASAHFLSRFSPDTSPDDDFKTPRTELERNIDMRTQGAKAARYRRSRSAEPMRHSSASAASPAEAAATMRIRMPQDLRTQRNWESNTEADSESRRKMTTATYDEVKNKPLPRIALL
ncbi:hypothetical protein BKA66DRAFT_259519 [Pyrenochaeta sp. MPI-SDFR-AT-0127]|nr:hypothetical protein BKA66DRAFT_259519 [Pyrenochaeta sp. MPI-SDFR-AT-0127]